MKKFFTAFIVICLIVGVGYIFLAKGGINIPIIPTNPSENTNNKYDDERKDYVVRNKDGLVIGIKRDTEVFSLSKSEKEKRLEKVVKENENEDLAKNYKKYFLNGETTKFDIDVENSSVSDFIFNFYETLNKKLISDETFYAYNYEHLFGRIKDLGDINGVGFTCKYENNKYYNISIADKYYITGFKYNNHFNHSKIYKANKDLAKWVVGVNEEISYSSENDKCYNMDDKIIFSNYNPNTSYHTGLSNKSLEKFTEMINNESEYDFQMFKYDNKYYELSISKNKVYYCTLKTDFETIWNDISFDTCNKYAFGDIANQYYLALFDFLFKEYKISYRYVYKNWLYKSYEETTNVICSDLGIDYSLYSDFSKIVDDYEEILVPYLDEKYGYEKMVEYYCEKEKKEPISLIPLNNFEEQIPQKVTDGESVNDSFSTGTYVSCSWIYRALYDFNTTYSCANSIFDCDETKTLLVNVKDSNTSDLSKIKNENFKPSLYCEVEYSRFFDFNH